MSHDSVEKIETQFAIAPECCLKLISNAGQIMASKLRRMDRYTLGLFPAAHTSD